MTWKEASIMDLRKEFVSLANQADANIRELCHRFQISSGVINTPADYPDETRAPGSASPDGLKLPGEIGWYWSTVALIKAGHCR